MRAREVAVSALVGGAMALSGMGVATADSPAVAPATVSQTYSCSVIGTTQTGTATVMGKAVIVTSTTGVKSISLTGVVFSITNSFGLTATVNTIKIHLLDPNKISAPYILNSAKAGTTPPGWTAGHDTTGTFLLFSGSTTFASGTTKRTAALRARYRDKGPRGTVIAFHPGNVTFSVTSPVVGSASCTPSGTLTTIASVTE